MSEQNLQSCLKLRNSQNPFFHILETLNKNYEKNEGGCHDALKKYGALKFSTVYVVKSPVLGLQRLFSKKL